MKKHKVYTKQQTHTRIVLVNVICFILSVIFTLLILCQLSVRSALKNTTIDKSFNNIDYSKIIVQNGEEELSLDTYINEYYILDDSVTDEDINDLLVESTANEFIETKYNELTQYILGGTYKIPSVTPEEIAQELDKNKTLIYDNSSIRFLSDDHAELITALEGPLNSFNASISGSRVVSYLRTFCSLALMIAFAAILLVILVVWAVIYSNLKERIYPAIRNFSVAAALSSAVWTAVLLIASASVSEKFALKGALDITTFTKNVYVHCAFIAIAFLVVFLLIGAVCVIIGIKTEKNFVSEKIEVAEIDENALSDDDSDNGMETVYTAADDIIPPEQEEIIPEPNQQDEGKKAEINDLITEIAPDSEIGQRIQKNTAESTGTIETPVPVQPEEVPVAPAQPAQPPVGKHEEEIAMPEINSVGAVPSNGRTCPKCGKVNLSRNLFCSECGELLK